MIRLVVTDLDGTFWDSQMVVPNAHVDAVRALAERGVEVVVATSRRARVVGAQLRRCDLAPAAILLDGALGVDLVDGRRFHRSPFEVDDATEVLAAFRRVGLEPCLYVDEPDVDVVLPTNPSTCRAHAANLADVGRVGDLDETVAAPGVYSFSVTGRPVVELEPLADDLAAFGAPYLLIDEPKYDGWSLIVAPPGVTKWTGVLAHCERRGIAPSEVLAVGDGDNDVEMLRHASVGVAVRGGTNAARHGADHVIEGPDDGGWAAILDLV